MDNTIKLTEVSDVVTPASETYPENYNFAIESTWEEHIYSEGGGEASGTIDITSNGTHNVAPYASANVNVPTGITPSGSQTFTENGTYDVTNIAEAVVNVESSGGREVVLLASGQYTLASNTSNMSIPVSFSGTPVRFLVYAHNPIEDTAQSFKWCCQIEHEELFAEAGATRMASGYYRTTSGGSTAFTGGIDFNESNNTLYCPQQGKNYPVVANTYNWYVWGYAE